MWLSSQKIHLTMKTIQANSAKNRITQIYQYLEALDQRRNPPKSSIKDQPWVFWLRDLPKHPSVQIGTMEDSGFILKLKRPPITHAPSPPKQIDDWVKPGWKDINGKLDVFESLNRTDQNNSTIIVRFDEDSLRVEQLQNWKAKWEQWQVNEKPAREALRFFERIYGLYGDIDRDSEKLELVLGDGILNWRLNSGDIHHPILLIRVQLEFDPEVPEFTLVETERPVEFYSALFRKHPAIDGQRIGKLREELEDGGFHPLGPEDTSGYMTRLVRSLSPNGQFIAQGEPQGFETEPRIGRDPVIFLRARTLGFATALDAIIQSLKDEDLELILPSSLVNIVGIETEVQPDKVEDGSTCYANEDESILLSKPANPEQLQIARRLEKFGSVLVQGPPGTGKTHTIANLIGHLLAQGKSILVTSHTTKALSVLREQVVPELQPLCVSSLESDTQSRAELEFSINSIVQRLASSDSTKLQREIVALTQQRRDLLDRLAATRQRLLEGRTDEYRSVVIDGQGTMPTSAAKRVAEGAETDSWIPSPILLGCALPLSVEELTELYASNGIITQEDEEAYATALPDLESLIEPFEFDQIVENHQKLENDIKNKYDYLWNASPETQTSEPLHSLFKKVMQVASTLQDVSQWRLDAIEAGRQGGPHRQPWDSLLNLIDTVNQESVCSKDTLLKFDPQLASNVEVEEQERLLSEIVEFLGNGQKLNGFNLFWHKQWKQFIPQLKVNQRAPENFEEFQALRTKAQLEIQIRTLRERWDRQMASLGGPISSGFTGSVQAVCLQYKPLIQDCLEWYHASWQPLEKELLAAGFLWNELWETTPPQLKQYGDFYRLQEALVNVPEVFEERISHIQKLNIEKTLEALNRQVNTGESQQTPITAAIREALMTRDFKSYRLIHTRLVRLHNNKSVFDRRNHLLCKLEPAAKGWTLALRTRSGVHANKELPGNPESAWLWRQWHDELERRGSISIDSIQKDIENLSEELKGATTKLIDAKAWLAQVSRTNTPQRQALMGWLQTMSKIGAGKGKRVPKLLVQARNLMQKSRSAVPVWIMPLSKVVENFDFNSTKFDVVIIDEASQSDVMGLVAFFLGKQVVIVGDHKQVSPLAVGQKIEEVDNLIQEFLYGIPNAHLYDGKTSVYDLALQSFSGLICLKEHFRCVPEIIQFSNWLSYNGEIKPLRDSASVTIKPSVIPYQVSGGYSDSKVNKAEAITISSLLKACIDKPQYADKSFGVISLLGEEQANWIDSFLRGKLEPAQYEKHKIRCGISAQFQGDERQVIFLSMVDGPIEGTHSMRQGGTDDMYKKRYNVAVSRAKDQLWVIHSLQPEDHLKAGDIRRQLIEYANNPQAFIQELENEERKTESEFERLVLRSLKARSFKVIPQWKVGYYRIDMVVEGNGKRLAIECDGERYHPPEKLPEDLARQANLERMGWRFLRIRGSEFFRNPDKAMERVFEKLQELEIYPSETLEFDGSGEFIQDSELLKQIKRDAEAIRRQWKTEDPNLAIFDTADPMGFYSIEDVAESEDDFTSDTALECPASTGQVIDPAAMALYPLPATEPNDKNATVQTVEHRKAQIDLPLGFDMTALQSEDRGVEREFEDLIRTDFSYMDLEKASFSWSDLKEASFTGSNLKGAKFRESNLVRADFSSSNLEDANFQDAKVWLTDFKGALYNRNTTLPDTVNPEREGMIRTD